MTIEEMAELFEKLGNKSNGEYLKFERIEKKLSRRPDIHAFILLDQLSPKPGRDMVAAAKHDEVWLGVDVGEVAAAITREQVVDLYRCGISYDEETGSFHTFV